MINIDKVLKTAKERNASDIHLIFGLKPMLRISRDLIPMEEIEELNVGHWQKRLLIKGVLQSMVR